MRKIVDTAAANDKSMHWDLEGGHKGILKDSDVSMSRSRHAVGSVGRGAR